MPLTRLPSLSSLRAFEAAARRGSIKEAASELSVSPGAVSQQIKALEADLGVPLFVRKTRAIHLTPAGQRLQPTVSEAFLQIRQIVDEVRPDKAATLRINATNALIGKWLLPRLHRFTKNNPDVQVQIGSDMSSGNTSAPEADIEIRYASEPPKDMYTELMHREIMLVVASPTLLETYDIKTAQDLKHATVLYDAGIVKAGDVPSWDYWENRAGLPGLIDRSRAVTFDRPPGGQLVDAAIAGVGVAICGSLLSYTALADGRLVCPFGPVMESGSNYYACCRPGRERKRHIRSFLSWLHEEASILTTLNAMHEASL